MINLPLGFGLTTAATNQVGLAVGRQIIPHLNAMQSDMQLLRVAVQTLGSLFEAVAVRIIQPIQGIEQMALGVFLRDPAMREHIEATRWAIAYFSYNTFLEALRALWGIRRRLGRNNNLLEVLHQDLVSLDFDLVAIGNSVVALLTAILNQLQTGLLVGGSVTLVIDGGSFSGLDLSDLAMQILKLSGAISLLNIAIGLLDVALASLAAGLTLVAGAVKLLAMALNSLPDNLGEIIDQLKRLGLGLILLGGVIATLGRGKLIEVGLGFLGIALFIRGLAWALNAFSQETLKVIPALKQLFDHIVAFGNALKAFNRDELIQIGLSFLGIALFIRLLAWAMSAFDAQVLEAIPHLQSLWEGLLNLADGINAFTPDELLQIGMGFFGIALFIGLLGWALGLMNAETLNTLPALQQLFDSLLNLANAIVGFSIEQLIQIGLGFLGIAVFVGLLGFAMQTFSGQALEALPGLAMLIEQLNNLINSLTTLDAIGFLKMAAGFALIASFVFLLSVAIERATPGLTALDSVLGKVAAGFEKVANAASRAWSAVESAGSVVSDYLPSIPSWPSYQEGGVMPHTGLAFLHAGERVLNVRETQAFDNGLLTPFTGEEGGGTAVLPSLGSGGGGTDRSVNIDGGITINISAERVDPDTASLLSDEIVQQLMDRLNELQSEQNFRNGIRTPAYS